MVINKDTFRRLFESLKTGQVSGGENYQSSGKGNNMESKNVSELAEKYIRTKSKVNDVERKLENLNHTKDHISKERFDSLFKAYNVFLEEAKPLLSEVTKELDERIKSIEKNINELNSELEKIKASISEETKLFEMEVVSKESYNEKIRPLKKVENEYNTKIRKNKSQLQTLIQSKEGNFFNKAWNTTNQKPHNTPGGGTLNNGKPPKFYKNPSISAVLSFLYTGLGQIYNGEITKGVVLLILMFISLMLMMVIIGFITSPILWLWGIYDAYKSANRINEKLALS